MMPPFDWSVLSMCLHCGAGLYSGTTFAGFTLVSRTVRFPALDRWESFLLCPECAHLTPKSWEEMKLLLDAHRHLNRSKSRLEPREPEDDTLVADVVARNRRKAAALFALFRMRGTQGPRQIGGAQ